MRFSAFLVPVLLFCSLSTTRGGETITLNGQAIRNCSLVEISSEGPIYLCGDTNVHHVLPWSQLTPVQEAAIRASHNEALVNAICDARYVNGTVFHANKDGVIVQVSLEGEEHAGTEGFLNGARVLKSGLVIISDLPLDIPRSAGDPIKVTAYFKEKSKFDMVIAATEMDHLTMAKPDWFQVTDWTNQEGQTMQSKLVGVRDDKVLFEKADGTRFVYNLSQLDPASQEKAKRIHARLSSFPVP